MEGKITYYSFEMIIGKTPGTSPLFLGCMTVFYLVSLYALSKYMTKHPAKKLLKLSTAHNFILAIISFVTAGGIILELISESFWPEHSDNKFTWFYCISRGKRLIGPLYFWSYIYYLTKFYELVDSYLIILRKSKKGLSFLHVVHHATMMLLSWSWFLAGFAMLYIPPLLNSIVHVIMYIYYGFASLGIRWRLRNYITIIQIIQFIIGVIFFAVYLPGRYFFGINCSGNIVIMTANSCFDIFFFYLFYDYYQNEYKKKKKIKVPISQPISEEPQLSVIIESGFPSESEGKNEDVKNFPSI